MKRLLPLSGLVAIAVGLGFIMPAVAQWKDQGSLPWWSALLLALGVLITCGGAFLAMGFIRRHSR